ncbi:CLUMA_CG021122, isoform A [Clunio marinus]|uniref:CLUMA_CG021122, isoform A n=1 Tax=Clunio marinus TaxID=568069 RepID=A0A1J1J877_9DIPT|nr:CLUMA_CG021122, isoform A [Clunio marinus]
MRNSTGNCHFGVLKNKNGFFPLSYLVLPVVRMVEALIRLPHKTGYFSHKTHQQTSLTIS